MRILYVIPGTGMPLAERRRREALLNRLVQEGTRVTVMALSEGPPSIESEEDEQQALQPLLTLLKTQECSHDAFIIGCAGDAGLEEARALLQRPVAGPGEASFLLGTAGYERFAMVTANPLRTASKFALAARSGLNPERMVASLSVAIPVLDMRQDPDRTCAALTRACLEARDRGAQVVLLGCMSLAFAGETIIKTAEEKAGLAIVNPVVAAVNMAQTLYALRKGLPTA